MADYAAGKPWKLTKQQHIMEAAYQLFSQKGIELVTMSEVAEASGVGRATLYRYFDTKLQLAVAISDWKWDEYITLHNSYVTAEQMAQMSGAEFLRFYMDAFIDLYNNFGDLLRFNYNFNSYLRYAATSAEQRQPAMGMIDRLTSFFHGIYERGAADGTLDTSVPEETMFTTTLHIMIAAATRYAVGLVYVSEKTNPESELAMLEELLLSRFVRNPNGVCEDA